MGASFCEYMLLSVAKVEGLIDRVICVSEIFVLVKYLLNFSHLWCEQD